MTYYDRLRNRHDRHLYESPEEKNERFRKLLENQEISEQKDLYKCECREDDSRARHGVSMRKKKESLR